MKRKSTALLRELPARTRQSMAVGWNASDNTSERLRYASALGWLQLLNAKARATGLRSPVRALGSTLHFGDFTTFTHIFQEVFAEQPYAIELPTSAPVIFDCGANIGLSVLYFKQRFPGAVITAFEPDPDVFSLLSRNVEANLIDGVETHQVAVGAADGEAEFHYEPTVAGSARGAIGDATARPFLTGTRKVPVKRLSGFVSGRVDLLKLDVEGSEGAVLTDLETSGKLANVERIMLEFHHHLGNEGLSLAETLALLERSGFEVQIATPYQRTAVREGIFQDVYIYAYRSAGNGSQ